MQVPASMEVLGSHPPQISCSALARRPSEDTGLIGALGCQVLRDALAALAEWRDEGLIGDDVCAEGIEHPGQLERLRAVGCDFGQGHLFWPALDAASALVSGQANSLAVEEPLAAPGCVLGSSCGDATRRILRPCHASTSGTSWCHRTHLAGH